MSHSYKIGTVFGITLRIHALLLVLVALFLLKDPATGIVIVGTLFATVFLHELGHCLVAKSFGVKVVDITFWPMGGLARMSEIPEKTRVEALIAVAGPAVNFVLAALAVPVWLLLESTASSGLGLWAAGFARWFLWINLVLGGFNLIPAFPMDGARVLRALLGSRHDWITATEKTASIGRSIAVAMGLLGLAMAVVLGRFDVLLISVIFAVWIFWSCIQEVVVVRMRRMRTAFESASGGGGVGFNPFNPGGGPDGPIGEGGASGASIFGPRRPEQAPPSSSAGGGFSPEDIERLERHRGRLSSFSPDDEEP